MSASWADRRLTLIATSAFGLEAVVARELRALGYEDLRVTDGRIAFEADAAAIARTNLWLRSADRVLLQLGEFEAPDFGVLFDETKALPWSDWLPEDAAFPVRARTVRSALHSPPHCQSIVKKAMVESLKGRYGREVFPETGATFQIDVVVRKDVATLALDTSGAGLHKRGYRDFVGAAPLKETLAAALLQLTFWKRDRPLADPFCGSGTIPIEAALIARNRAPGLQRDFAAESWPGLPTELWESAREEARSLQTSGPVHRVIAGDADERALRLARRHARAAGVEEDIHFQRQDVSELSSPRSYGCIVTNPPYGARLEDPSAVEPAYRGLATALARLETWSCYVLTAHPAFEALIGRRADRRRKLYNGRIECTYHQLHGPRPPRRSPDD